MTFPDSTRHCRIPTPLGDLLLAATDRGLSGAWFTQRQRDLPDSARWRDAPQDRLLL